MESRTYPIFEFERKGKKLKRRRRIAVVNDSSSPVWFPLTVDYSSRVKLDGGTVDSLICVNLAILKLT